MQRRDPVCALVTGGAGFIGSHLAEFLLSAGQKVRVLDSLLTGKEENIPPGAEFLKGDVRDRHRVREALQGIDVVHHLAALPSVPRSLDDPHTTNEINVGGTFTVLTEAAQAGVRRLVFASSSSVYGDSGTLPKNEDLPPEPMSPYAASKFAGEIACRAFTHACGLDTVCLRFFNVYGPRQDPGSPYSAVVPVFLSRLLEGKDLPVYGDGKQTRDFTHVSDVARGMARAADAEGVAGKVFNLAGERPRSVIELAQAAGRALGAEPRLRFEPPRPGEVRQSYGDSTRARAAFGFRAETDLEEGLRRTVEAIRKAS